MQQSNTIIVAVGNDVSVRRAVVELVYLACVLSKIRCHSQNHVLTIAPYILSPIILIMLQWSSTKPPKKCGRVGDRLMINAVYVYCGTGAANSRNYLAVASDASTGNFPCGHFTGNTKRVRDSRNSPAVVSDTPAGISPG